MEEYSPKFGATVLEAEPVFSMCGTRADGLCLLQGQVEKTKQAQQEAMQRYALADSSACTKQRSGCVKHRIVTLWQSQHFTDACECISHMHLLVSRVAHSCTLRCLRLLNGAGICFACSPHWLDACSRPRAATPQLISVQQLPGYADITEAP